MTVAKHFSSHLVSLRYHTTKQMQIIIDFIHTKKNLNVKQVQPVLQHFALKQAIYLSLQFSAN